jgi:phospholipid/cholesterol/gamma-HCH transport system substrate-binding protein
VIPPPGGGIHNVRPGEERASGGGRLPERDRRVADGKHRLSNAQVGVIAVVLLIIGIYLAFAKEIPFASHGYTLRATFTNAVNIRADSPVRIAGVNVGKVLSLSRDGNNSTVTFTVDDSGRPVHSDAFVAIRPRIFFEGNWFLDLSPGEPGTPELASGATIPISHTSTAVQFDQVLSALQTPERENLGKVLIQYGKSLSEKPSAAENQTQQPEAQGLTGGEALNKSFAYGGTAGRAGAQVTQAFQGTETHDLSRLITSAGTAFGAFVQDDGQLQGLISNFDTTMGAFAARSASLDRAVAELGPTVATTHRSLTNLNASLPALRRFSIDLRPAVAEIPATITAGYPWIAAAHPLLAADALGSDAASLEQATPSLGGAQQAGYGALDQLGALSECETHTLQPTANQVIGDQFAIGQPNYREFFYATTGLAGESQGFDANGPYLRIQAGGGDKLLHTTDPNPIPNIPTNRTLYAANFQNPIGTQPLLGPAPAKNPNAACSSQPVPDLNGPAGQVGPADPHP